MPVVAVCASEEIGEGEKAQFSVGDVSVMICRADGKLYAVNAVCPHRGAFLTQGVLEGTRVRCPWHDWEFDVATGEGITNPFSCVSTFPVEERNGRVVLTLD